MTFLLRNAWRVCSSYYTSILNLSSDGGVCCFGMFLKKSWHVLLSYGRAGYFKVMMTNVVSFYPE